MQQLTEQQYKSLRQAIYNFIMGLTMYCECGEECTLGMGEMGETSDEAERVVNEWMELNKITLKEDNQKNAEKYLQYINGIKSKYQK